MRTKTRIVLCTAIIALSALSIIFAAPRADTASIAHAEEGAAPCFVKGSAVKAGDCVVVVAKNYKVALGEESSGSRLAPVSVKTAGSGEGKHALKKANKLFPEAECIFLKEPKKYPEELSKVAF